MQTNIAYMKALADAITRAYQCPSLHLQTVPVILNETGAFWQGDVEVFALLKGCEARKCFAWATSGVEAVIVLASQGISSAVDAVRTHYATIGSTT